VIRGIYKVPDLIGPKHSIENDWSPCFQTLNGHSDSVNSVAFSHDGTLVASTSLGQTVKLWDTATGQHLQTLKGHNNKLILIAFSRDDKRITLALNNLIVMLWETATEKCLQPLACYSNTIRSVILSPNDTLFASTLKD
jgi:WD40 repeat protein